MTELIVAGPVIVAAVELGAASLAETTAAASGADSPSGSSVETVAVGSLKVHQVEEEDETAIVFVGTGEADQWAFPLRRGSQIFRTGSSFLLSTTSPNAFFSVALPPKVGSAEEERWAASLEAAGCTVQELEQPLPVEGASFLGLEYDGSGAEEIALLDGAVQVPKGGSACIPVELDNRGYFYWTSRNGRRERTRPRWRETNCVTCRRASSGRQITWECHLVPQRGEAPDGAKAALEASRAAAAEASQARWAARKEKASQWAVFGLQGVAAAAPVVAGGVKIAATGAAMGLEITSDIARMAIQPAEEELQVHPEVQAAVEAVHGISTVGAEACSVARRGVEWGASQVGQQVVQRLNSSSSALGDQAAAAASPEAEGEDQLPRSTTASDLASAGGAAGEGIAQVLKEVNAARAVVKEATLGVVGAAVGARYGAAAEDTFGKAKEAVGAVAGFRESSAILTKKGAGLTAAEHVVRGAIEGGGAGGDGESASSGAQAAIAPAQAGYPTQPPPPPPPSAPAQLAQPPPPPPAPQPLFASSATASSASASASAPPPPPPPTGST